jgi:formylglycine-generating enzyme
MTRLSAIAWTPALLSYFAAHVAWAGITIETVPVGNARNPPDPLTGFGQVSYDYRIAKYELLAGQYTAFLNAVAGVDTYGLYHPSMAGTMHANAVMRSGGGTLADPYTYSVAPEYADRPMSSVTFARACRFVNWLENGQPTGAQGAGTTETGSYTITPEGLANNTITRNPGSTWVIPTDNEWYKAAYHKNDGVTNHYYLYPTSSDEAPGRDLADPLGNNANYAGPGPFPIDNGHYYTVAGEFQNSASPYGTFDQGGNLDEFNELINGVYRGIRGGDFGTELYRLRSTAEGFIHFGDPNAGSGFVGVRIAQVPEPTSLALLPVAGAWLLNRRRRSAQP